MARIDARADESGVLAKTTVLEVVHHEGERLQAAAHTRAEAVFARDPEALRLFVPETPQREKVDDPGGSQDDDDSAAEDTPRFDRD